ncbi:MAG: hypothetical protein JNK45_01280 [Myxococcales bacterium]|nr:hypothetical protein [Myxococcales bacterium]
MSNRRAALRDVGLHLCAILGLSIVCALVVGLGGGLGDRGLVEVGAAVVIYSVPVAGASYRVLVGGDPSTDGRGLRAVGRLLTVVAIALVWSAVLVPTVLGALLLVA